MPPDSGTEKGKDSTIFPSFKLMLSGKTVGVSFLNTHVTSHDVEINKLYQSQRVIPLFHILVQNPFLSLQISDDCFESELSCFNMAALYTDHPTPLGEQHCLNSLSLNRDAPNFDRSQHCCTEWQYMCIFSTHAKCPTIWLLFFNM